MSENVSLPGPTGLSYIIDDDLRAAVEVALDLGMPLLVTGEPGTGKTRLAEYVAKEMLKTEVLPFYTKTTSKAKDLLYRYDALSHFRDSQMKEEKANPMEYIVFQPLGEAILHASSQQYVVLVDEIDKAPRDFPNDVLFEFDEMAFKIDEVDSKSLEEWLGKHKEFENLEVDKRGFFRTDKVATKRPVLILTSNSEKNLPDAFLRRCVYFHIEFPQAEKLIKIVNENVGISDSFTEQMMKAAVTHFALIRNNPLKKLPATAELLAWIKVLKKKKIDITKVLEDENGDMFTQLRQLIGILFKNKEDLEWAQDNLEKLIADTQKAMGQGEKTNNNA